MTENILAATFLLLFFEIPMLMIAVMLSEPFSLTGTHGWRDVVKELAILHIILIGSMAFVALVVGAMGVLFA